MKLERVNAQKKYNNYNQKVTQNCENDKEIEKVNEKLTTCNENGEGNYQK